jgi:hypothetical protein
MVVPSLDDCIETNVASRQRAKRGIRYEGLYAAEREAAG